MRRYDLLCLEGLAQALRVFNKQEDTPQYSIRNISKGSMVKMHVKPEVLICEELYVWIDLCWNRLLLE